MKLKKLLYWFRRLQARVAEEQNGLPEPIGLSPIAAAWPEIMLICDIQRLWEMKIREAFLLPSSVVTAELSNYNFAASRALIDEYIGQKNAAWRWTPGDAVK
jgi:hypothetical protein